MWVVDVVDEGELQFRFLVEIGKCVNGVDLEAALECIEGVFEVE